MTAYDNPNAPQPRGEPPFEPQYEPQHDPNSDRPARPSDSSAGLVALAWLFVGLPLAWGIWQTLLKSLDLFRAAR